MPTFSFPKTPENLTTFLQCRWNAPLPLQLNIEIYSFGKQLMPDYYPRQTARLVGCYALFK